jgi:two-component system, OmpR family, sensor histidine kinase BaeS
VRQVLGGLVRNAVVYAPATSAVVIRVRDADEGDGAVVEVEDTGSGVPPEELDRIFEFGFRGQLARTLKVPGLGAGLWICRELARRNGGDVRLTSAPGTGVTATLSLPASREEQE